ncbi:hypothetical protein [uncultured Helicobacter sp.]|uniref:hypothetical protein n=1 Tax=uncultured Helicobacter sp. TaxID=175537 RepID=UPI003752A62F
MIIDTGMPRSLNAHAVSGAAAGLIAAGISNYQQYKKGEISKPQALGNTIKSTAQGALLGICTIGIANALGSPKAALSNVLESSAYLLVGVAGSYALENIDFSQFFTQGALNDNKHDK